ncbi:MAG: hypothetical protein BMS9Abin08_1713 [Gammaproteobacteria bacterium]|nr:MAG: hypothetical protein BMS9Abin08_1713 [Gammaproteobacteria bacterium]
MISTKTVDLLSCFIFLAILGPAALIEATLYQAAWICLLSRKLKIVQEQPDPNCRSESNPLSFTPNDS